MWFDKSLLQYIKRTMLKLSSPLRTDQNTDDNKEHILAGQDISKFEQGNTPIIFSGNSFFPQDISTPIHAGIAKSNGSVEKCHSELERSPIFNDESTLSSGEPTNPFISNCEVNQSTVLENRVENNDSEIPSIFSIQESKDASFKNEDYNTEIKLESNLKENQIICPNEVVNIPQENNCDLLEGTNITACDSSEQFNEVLVLPIKAEGNIEEILNNSNTEFDENILQDNKDNISSSEKSIDHVTNKDQDNKDLKSPQILTNNIPACDLSEQFNELLVSPVETEGNNEEISNHSNIELDQNIFQENKNNISNSANSVDYIKNKDQDNKDLKSPQIFTSITACDSSKQLNELLVSPKDAEANNEEISKHCNIKLDQNIIPQDNKNNISNSENSVDYITNKDHDNKELKSPQIFTNIIASDSSEQLNELLVSPNKAEANNEKISKHSNTELDENIIFQENKNNISNSENTVDYITNKDQDSKDLKSPQIFTNITACDSSEQLNELLVSPKEAEANNEEISKQSSIELDENIIPRDNKNNISNSENSIDYITNKAQASKDIKSPQILEIHISPQKKESEDYHPQVDNKTEESTDTSEFSSSFANLTAENSSFEDFEKTTVVLVSDSSEKSLDLSFNSQGSPPTSNFCTTSTNSQEFAREDPPKNSTLGNCTTYKISDCNGFSETSEKLDNSSVEINTEVLNKSSSAFIVLSPPKGISVKIKVTPTHQATHQALEFHSPTAEEKFPQNLNDRSQAIISESYDSPSKLNTNNEDGLEEFTINEKPVDKVEDIPKKKLVDFAKMAELHEILHQEIADLKLEVNAAKQAKSILELEIAKKDEIILKTQAETIKKDQQHLQDMKALREQLKEKSTVNEKDKDLEDALKEAKAKESQAVSELNARMNVEMNYRKIMEEYEKTISAQLAHCQKSKEENETLTRHLANLELSFSDLHQKYERAKTIIEGFKGNEEKAKKHIGFCEESIRNQEEKYESLKAHARAQIEKSNKEIIQHREKYDNEVTKLNAIIKRLEIKSAALSTSLEQKSKECIALAALCDEVTGKKV